MPEWERMFFAKRRLQTTKWKNTKINFKTTGGVPSQIWTFPRVKPCFAFLANPFSVNVVGCPVQQPFVTHLTAAEIKLAEMQKIWLLRNFNQCHSAVNFWQQVPKSRGVTRLGSARGKKQAWRPHVWTWGLSEADAVSWIKYLWYCWDLAASPAVIRHPHSDSAPCELHPLCPPRYYPARE